MIPSRLKSFLENEISGSLIWLVLDFCVAYRSRQFIRYESTIIRLINNDVPSKVLESYRRQAKRTSLFVLYPLSIEGRRSEQMKELAIELISAEASASTIFLFEMSTLPTEGLPKFYRMKKLIKTIFHSSKRIITWNDTYLSVYPLFNLHYLPRQQHHLARFIPLHDRFKRWFAKICSHDPQCDSLATNSSVQNNCSCHYHRFFSNEYKWDLLEAHQVVFREAPIISEHLASEIRSTLTIIDGNDPIPKSILCCLALSKFRIAIKSDWCQAELNHYNRRRHPQLSQAMQTTFTN